MEKTYIGIDPGEHGALCILFPDEAPILTAFEDVNLYHVADLLRTASAKGPILAAIEDVSSRTGQGIASSFKFGFNTGRLHGLLIGIDIPFISVRPQNWQKEIWVSQDKVYKTVTRTLKDGTTKVDRKADPKPTSIKAATRLFPTVPLLRNPKCTKPHDGLADALLIAEYARRKNL